LTMPAETRLRILEGASVARMEGWLSSWHGSKV
jgi:hypothetical protein